MRFFQKTKESNVDTYFLIEVKGLFSIALLKFNPGNSTNYHRYAFNSLTWLLKGAMIEERVLGRVDSLKFGGSSIFSTIDKYGNLIGHKKYKRSLWPKLTKRDNLHKVYAKETSWCFTLRGPWDKTWDELDLVNQRKITLSNGRKVVRVVKL